MTGIFSHYSIQILKFQIKENIFLRLIIIHKIILDEKVRIREMETRIILSIWCREYGLGIPTVFASIGESKRYEYKN
jgi:hypothetical protein